MIDETRGEIGANSRTIFEYPVPYPASSRKVVHPANELQFRTFLLDAGCWICKNSPVNLAPYSVTGHGEREGESHRSPYTTKRAAMREERNRRMCERESGKRTTNAVVEGGTARHRCHDIIAAYSPNILHILISQ